MGVIQEGTVLGEGVKTQSHDFQIYVYKNRTLSYIYSFVLAKYLL